MNKRWRSSTRGEDLLFLLTSSYRNKNAFAPDNFRPEIEYSRSESLSQFFSAAFSLNFFARVLRVGEKVVVEFANEDDDALLAELVNELKYRLDISPAELRDGAINRIARATVDAVEASDRPIPNSVRKLLIAEHGRPACYICGKALGWRSSSGLPLVSVDHVWPSSWGGDSVVENLLPACHPCNTSRNDVIGWEWASAHAVVGPHDPGSYLRTLTSTIKSSLHLRAVISYASAANETLKNAAFAIGPKTDVQKVDVRDTTDFFNLIGHDIGRFDPRWSRA